MLAVEDEAPHAKKGTFPSETSHAREVRLRAAEVRLHYTALHMRSSKMAAWQRLRQELRRGLAPSEGLHAAVYYVNYEQLLAHPDETLRHMADAVGLQLTDTFVVPTLDQVGCVVA